MGVRLAPARGHFPPISDSGPSTALRVGCRFVWFPFLSPSASWPAGCHAATAANARGGSVVRFLPRAVLYEVGEDGADGGGSFDAGHDPQRAAAVDAGARLWTHTKSSGGRLEPWRGPACGACGVRRSSGKTHASCRKTPGVSRHGTACTPRAESLARARRSAGTPRTPRALRQRAVLRLKTPMLGQLPGSTTNASRSNSGSLG